MLLVATATIASIGLAWFAAGPVAERPSPNSPGHLGSRGALRTPRATAAPTPLGFARDAVIALHHYDTRYPRTKWRRGLLSTLGTPDGSLGVGDVDRLIPDAAQWAQMAQIGQRASATVSSAYVPALWRQTVLEHPELPDGAVGVTVTGTQLVTWAGGTSRVPVAVTVLLLCPPATGRCVVNRIAARVAR